MKRIGLIDNLVDIQNVLENKYHTSTAAEVMAATGGNTGNIAFVFGTRQLIKNPITRAGWGWTPEVVRQKFDQLVICCANQIGAHADLGQWAERLEKFELPVTLIGLGAQSDSYEVTPTIPEGTKKFLKVVTQLRPNSDKSNIGVRGQYTQKVLKKLKVESVATGCPSLFISAEPELGKKILERQGDSKYEKIAVAAGNPWHGPSAFLEGALVDIVNQYQGAYIVQHPESMLQIAYAEREKIAENTVKRFLESYGGRFDFESMMLWYRRNAHAFIDVGNWFRFVDKFDAVIGPRYHGVALGIQNKIPGCVFTIDSRTRELCEETAIKHLTHTQLKDLKSDEIVELSRWDSMEANKFDKNRAIKAKVYKDFIATNGLVSSESLQNLI